MQSDTSRPWTFYVLARCFALFLAFLYGPMLVIYILSFQGREGGLTFPLVGFSTHWFHELVTNGRSGDIAGSFQRSIGLAVIVTAMTVAISVAAGLGFRGPGHLDHFSTPRLDDGLAADRARRAAYLDAALRPAGDVRGDRPVQPRL